MRLRDHEDQESGGTQSDIEITPKEERQKQSDQENESQNDSGNESSQNGSQGENGQQKGEGKQGESGGKDKKKGVRTIAEWTTLAVCALLILGIAGYLAYEAFTQRERPFVKAETRILMDRVEKQGEMFILPVEVENGGKHTLRDITVQITYDGEDGKKETTQFTFDYLPELTTQKIYLYFERPPETLNIKAKPMQYRLGT